MAKITLNDVTSGYLSAAALNSRFQQIEDELNNKVLYRNNPVGEPNIMTNILDMNSNKIVNVANATNANDAINLSQLQGYLATANASQIVFTPAGNIAAINVQLAIQELDTEKAPVSHTHTKSQITDFAHTHVIADITDAGALASLNSVNTTHIDNNAVTFAKMQHIANNRLLGRTSGGSGSIEELNAASVKTFLDLTGTNSGDQTITLTGDVTGSGTGTFAATIANDAVTLAKMAHMATASFLGRNSAGTGTPEVLSVATAKTMLNLTGTNSGDQTITLTGDVTGTGTGSFAATISNDTVTFAKLQNIATATFLGRNTAGSGDTEELSVSTAKTMLGLTGTNSGDQIITLTGDVTGSGTGSFAATIANDAVTFAKMQNITSMRILGRTSASTGDIEEIDIAALTAKTPVGTEQVLANDGGTLKYILASALTGGGGGSGEINTASNVGTGNEWFKQKTGTDLEFRTFAVANGLSASLASDVWTFGISDAGITYAKIQNVSATDKLLGRSSAGAGVIEEITCTSAGRALIDDADAAAQRTTLGLGSLATLSTITVTELSNDAVTFAKIQNITTDRLLGRDTALTGDTEELTVGGGIEFTGSGGIQTSAFTGDVTKTAGGTTTTIANDAVTYAKIQNVSATNRLLGRYTASAGDIEEATLGADLEFSSGALRVGAFTGDITKTAGSLATTVLSASTTQAGKVELATAAETDTGTDATRAVTPDALKTSKWVIQSFVIACSDLTTAITATTNKAYFRMPYAFTVTAVRASLFTAQSTGNIFTVDINESGTSILSTKLTIDNTEKTSTTAATAAVISDTALADDAEITIDVDQIGDSTAKGLVVEIIGYRA